MTNTSTTYTTYKCRFCLTDIHYGQDYKWVDESGNWNCMGLLYHKPASFTTPEYKAPLPPVDLKINFTGEKLMHNDGTGDRYNLFLVSAFNPKTGEVVLEAKQVTAMTQKSAENKAVGLLSQNLPEGKTLDEVLDEVEVRVRPF